MLEEGLTLKHIVNVTSLEDASLPLLTDAFKGTVLKQVLTLKHIVNVTPLGDADLPLLTDAFKRNCA